MTTEPPLSRAPARGPSVLVRSLLVSAFLTLLGVIGLELWRPYYFLADDNFAFFYTMARELGTNWLAGRGPFLTDAIFGGSYDTSRDIIFLIFRGPLGLLAMLMAASPFHLWTVEIYAAVNLVLGAVIFGLLLERVGQVAGVPIPAGRRIVLTLSYTFSGYAVIVGASWGWYLGNQAALPMLALGLLAARARWGVLWVAAGVLHSLLGGHVHPTAWTLPVFGVWAAGLSLVERRARPLAVYLCGVALALAVAAPVLWPALEGWRQSERAVALSDAMVRERLMTPLQLVLSLFLGSWSQLFVEPIEFWQLSGWHAASIGSCLAAWKIFEGDRAPQQARSLKWLCIAMLGLLVVLIWRPAAVNALITHLPVLGSLRWPFKEYLFFLFFFHLWLGLRLPRIRPWAQHALTAWGGVILAVSLLVPAAPAFQLLHPDRQFLVQGRLPAFREWLEPSLGPERRIATVIPVTQGPLQRAEFPCLPIGGFNFAALLDVTSVSGYTTAPYRRNPIILRKPELAVGTFRPEHIGELRQADPTLTILMIEDAYPFVIRAIAPDGTVRGWPVPPEIYEAPSQP